jgi:AcrR family transcriptional regulator
MSIVKKKAKAKTARQRRSPQEVRTRALESARSLLAAQGPTAITLKAVADDLGMTHTNLIHHFGSAGELQSALMREMVSELTETIQAAMARSAAGELNRRQFVDLVFDAFDSGGAGRLAAWIVMSGNARLLTPVGQVVQQHIVRTEQTLGEQVKSNDLHDRVVTSVLLVTQAALGDSIIGEPLTKMVDRKRDALREIVTQMLYTIHGEQRR